MPKSMCKMNFRDVGAAIDRFEKAVRAEMAKIGEEAVEYAVENGNYQNRTGRLRASNKYGVTRKKLMVYNDAPYASYVEAKGFDVVSGAALYAEKRLKETFEK